MAAGCGRFSKRKRRPEKSRVKRVTSRTSIAARGGGVGRTYVYNNRVLRSGLTIHGQRDRPIYFGTVKSKQSKTRCPKTIIARSRRVCTVAVFVRQYSWSPLFSSRPRRARWLVKKFSQSQKRDLPSVPAPPHQYWAVQKDAKPTHRVIVH